MTWVGPPALPGTPGAQGDGPRAARQRVLVAAQVAASSVPGGRGGAPTAQPPRRRIDPARVRPRGRPRRPAPHGRLFRRRTAGWSPPRRWPGSTPSSDFTRSVSVEIPGTSSKSWGTRCPPTTSAPSASRCWRAASSPPTTTPTRRAWTTNRTLAERLWPGRPDRRAGPHVPAQRRGPDRDRRGRRRRALPTRWPSRRVPLAYLPLAQRFFPQAFLHARSPAAVLATCHRPRRLGRPGRPRAQPA